MFHLIVSVTPVTFMLYVLLSSCGCQRICLSSALSSFRFPVFAFARARPSEAANFRSQLLSRCAKCPHLVTQPPRQQWNETGGCFLRTKQNVANGNGKSTYPLWFCSTLYAYARGSTKSVDNRDRTIRGLSEEQSSREAIMPRKRPAIFRPSIQE